MRAKSLAVASRARDHLLATRRGLTVAPFTFEQIGKLTFLMPIGRQAVRQGGASLVPPCVCAAFLPGGGGGRQVGIPQSAHMDGRGQCGVVCGVVSCAVPYRCVYLLSRDEMRLKSRDSTWH